MVGGVAADLVVRSRRPADLDALVAVLAAVHEQDAYPVRASRVSADWLGDGTDVAWVALLDGHVVGHVALARTPDGWELTRYVVAVGARGRGVGRALLDVAEAWADADGLPMTLVVMEHNVDAQAVYARRGWARGSARRADFVGDDGRRPRMVDFRRAAARA